MNLCRVIVLAMVGGIMCYGGLALIVFVVDMANAEPHLVEDERWLWALVLVGFGACISYIGVWILSQAHRRSAGSPQEDR